MYFAQTRRYTWYLAKLNYILLLVSCFIFCHPEVYRRIFKLQWRQRKYFVSYAGLETIWLLWRFQETLHWETNWQMNVPYLCILIESINCFTESLFLYLFAGISYERYQVITHPIQSVARDRVVKSKVSSIHVGLYVGIMMSVLNVITLFRFNDKSTAKGCTLINLSDEDLSFIISLKSIKLFAMYFLPYLAMLSTNTALFYSMYRRSVDRSDLQASKSNIQSRKIWFSLSFLFISSFIMFACIAKPISELYLNVSLYLKWRSIHIFSMDNVLQGIIWNISTLGFMMNTLLAILYTAVVK